MNVAALCAHKDAALAAELNGSECGEPGSVVGYVVPEPGENALGGELGFGTSSAGRALWPLIGEELYAGYADEDKALDGTARTEVDAQGWCPIGQADLEVGGVLPRQEEWDPVELLVAAGRAAFSDPVHGPMDVTRLRHVHCPYPAAFTPPLASIAR